MPLDAICLRAVTNELNNVLAGCRVEKVYQPDRDEIVLQTRGGQGGPRRLLLSIAAGAPRVHFIDAARENPAAPPMFCMLLRKHVQGAKIAAVSQPAVERMLTIELDTTDEMGVPCKKHLICELMGKHSNVILCGEDNRIIDALRRVDGDLSGKRQVLPGLFYRMPPAQDKHDPFTVSGTGLEAFGLMVLPYAISVLCTAIGIVPLMVFLAFGRENKKQRMVRILSSWLSIVLLNGVATAVYNLTGLENLYLYTALATAGITYVLVKNLVVSVQRQKRQMSVVLYNKTVSVPCIGLLDSGNLLTMPLSGNPVHIADAALLQKLVDEKTVQKEIPYRALGNPHGKLQVYCMDGMKVETEPAKFCDWKQVWVGCAENGVLCNKPYQLILHASVADHCGCTKDPSQMTKKLRKEKRNVFTV